MKLAKHEIKLLMNLDKFIYKLNNRYYRYFIDEWLPIYRRQVFKARFLNDKEELYSIKNNSKKNINLSNQQKLFILKKFKFVIFRN